MPQRLRLEPVLVKLDPQVVKRHAGIVRVSDGLGANDTLLLVIKDYLDLVIRSLLPVFGSRGPVGASNFIGIRKDLVKLPKGILGVVPSGMS